MTHRSSPPLLRSLAVLLILSGGASPTSAQTPAPPLPALDRAEVRIPYTELRKLWESAHAMEKGGLAETPPPGALLSADFRADLSAGKFALEAEFKVENFSGKWERIRLMGAGLPIARVEPADVRVVVEGENLLVLTREAGPVVLKLRFAEMALPPHADGVFLNLATTPSAVAALKVTGLPAGRLLKIRDKTIPTAADGACQVPLPVKGGETLLTLADAASEPKPEPPLPPIQPSVWTVQNEVLVLEGEGELRHLARVQLIAVNGSALEATLHLPATARGVDVTKADDIKDWKVVRNAQGSTELRLRWQTRDLMEREFRLAYSLPQLPLAPAWELHAPALATDEKTRTLFVFALPPGMELSAPDLQSPVPPARLSKWVAEESQASKYGTVLGARSLTLAAKLLPRMETASAVVTKSTCVTKLVADGSVLTEVKFELEHQESVRWLFSLPEKSTLLKCAINNVPVNPIARDKGSMELALPAAAKSEVSFSITEAKGKLDAVEGQATLQLPQTPLFIQELLWSIEMPEGYEAIGAEGNVQFATATPNDSSGALHLIKKLCRDERPQVELFYRKRGLE